MKHLLALALLCGAGSAATDAAASGFAAPSPGARLTPGRSALASFELPSGLREIEEMELVLSLDGGSTFPLRLTGELSPGTRRTGWRVPALPTAQAVLALRTGDADGEERIVLVSGSFTILGDPSASSEDIRFAHGEWRTREAGFGGVFPCGDGSVAGEGDARLSALADEADLDEPGSWHPALSQGGKGRPAGGALVSSPPSLHSRILRLPVHPPRRE